MRLWLVFCTILLAAAPVCRAHWTDHPELPAWAQRGRLYWCLHYARADRRLVDLFLDGGRFPLPTVEKKLDLAQHCRVPATQRVALSSDQVQLRGQ